MDVGAIVDIAVRWKGDEGVNVLGAILISLKAQEECAQEQSNQHPTPGGLCSVVFGSIVRQDDGYARANQYKRVDGTDPFLNVHIDRLGPGTSWHTKTDNDVSADQGRKEHDFGRQEQPEHGLAARHG